MLLQCTIHSSRLRLLRKCHKDAFMETLAPASSGWCNISGLTIPPRWYPCSNGKNVPLVLDELVLRLDPSEVPQSEYCRLWGQCFIQASSWRCCMLIYCKITCKEATCLASKNLIATQFVSHASAFSWNRPRLPRAGRPSLCSDQSVSTFESSENVCPLWRPLWR